MATKTTLKKKARALVEEAFVLFEAPRSLETYKERAEKEDELYDRLGTLAVEAKKVGTLVGRSFDVHVADGKATYVVLDTRAKKVLVHIVPLCDGYTAPYIGEGRWLETKWVTNEIILREKLAELFAKKTA